MIIIEKYGGSVLKDISIFSKVKERLLNTYNKENKYLLILSAMKNMTNSLYNVSTEFKLPKIVKDKFIANGEDISCKLLYEEIKDAFNTCVISPTDIDLFCHNKRIQNVNIEKILNLFKKYDVLILPGFYGINKNNDISLLSRNASDTTAIYIYNTLIKQNIKAKCTLYKDEVLYQIDPKIKNSIHLKNICFDELELIKDHNKSFISSDALSLIINNKLNLEVIKFDTNEKTIISEINSKLNLLGIYYEKRYIVKIFHFENKKLLNYLSKITNNNYNIHNNIIEFRLTKNKLRYLSFIKLIDASIKYKIEKVIETKKVYKTNTCYVDQPNNLEAFYEDIA